MQYARLHYSGPAWPGTPCRGKTHGSWGDCDSIPVWHYCPGLTRKEAVTNHTWICSPLSQPPWLCLSAARSIKKWEYNQKTWRDKWIGPSSLRTSQFLTQIHDSITAWNLCLGWQTHKDAQSMFTYADETRGLETLQIHMFMALAT